MNVNTENLKPYLRGISYSQRTHQASDCKVKLNFGGFLFFQVEGGGQ
jgi:hypothetical protein